MYSTSARQTRRRGPVSQTRNGQAVPTNPLAVQTRRQLQPPTAVRVYPGQTLPELTVLVRGLPLNVTTFDLWNTFHSEGQIVVVELFDDRHGEKTGLGKVRFSPPPNRPFWHIGRYQFVAEDSTKSCTIHISKDESRAHRDGWMISPNRRHIRYPEHMTLTPSFLEFGLMLQPETIMTMASAKDFRKTMSFSVDMLRRRIVPRFELLIADPRDKLMQHQPQDPGNVGKFNRILEYKFEMPFDQIRAIYRMELTNDTHFALIISQERPSRFFRKLEDVRATHRDGLFWNESDTWIRQTDIVYDPESLHTLVCSLNKDQPVVDIGRWTTYRWIFEKAKVDQQVYELMETGLKDYNIEIRHISGIDGVGPSVAPIWSWIDPPSALQVSGADIQSLSSTHVTYYLPFEVRYQLEVCMSKNTINEHNITEEFIAKLASMENMAARYLLEYIAEQNRRIYNPMSISQSSEALAYRPRSEVPHYCAYQRKATITPTKIMFSTPSVETTNRVLRHYARENREGRFLRVQFTDEDEGKVFSCVDKKTNDELFSRVYRVLYNGIRIGDRHYQFLAFGNSQFRENGAYFFSPTGHLSCEDIRQWMGNFTHINVVAKYAARLGQCFSTTRAIPGLSKPEILTIDDVERNGYCFTDGVGKISPFLAKMIASELSLSGDRPPSAFQFRLGGCKGLLVVWEDAKNNQVHIRKSQQKFTAIYNGLEIVRCAQFSSATLNRQTITILSTLGVKDEVFLDMMEEELHDYQTALSDTDVAVRMLSRHIDDNQMTINIASMILNGFMSLKEPFVMSLLHLWRTWSIKLLKEKARITVEKGAFVFGCVDETGILKGYTAPKPNSHVSADEELPEIFIQVPLDRDDSSRSKYVVIEGICLVGRNPSLHPGDLRVVKAVNVPALHHLRDVVMFPQTGDRDVPGMCSGGDLDGDDFFVIWDEKLQPREWNCTPMDYTPPKSKNLKRQVAVRDLLKFFVKYMKNDSLPAIAHAHLAQADYRQASVKDPICLELAQLHSKAVDYVKTGQPAELSKNLQPRKWPHFMEKWRKPKEAIYHSDRILGKLYDKVERVDFTPQYDLPFDKRILRAYQLDSGMLKSARQIKSQYDIAMRRIMAQQDIQTEFEVWSTFILSRPKAGSDYKAQEQMKFITEDLKKQFRADCEEKAGGKDFSVLAPFVAAMYKVTKEEVDIALAECRTTKMIGGVLVPKRRMHPKYMPLISFPWLFERELARIATGVDNSDNLDDLGLQTYTHNQLRKPHVGPIADEEDFVRLENGKIIHRGEEIEPFGPDIDSLDGDSDFEEANAEKATSSAEETSDSEGFVDAPSKHDKGSESDEEVVEGTGVEEIVPRIRMEGLIGRDGSLLPAALQTDWQSVDVTGSPISPAIDSSSSVNGTPLESPPTEEEEIGEEVEEEVEGTGQRETALDRLNNFIETMALGKDHAEEVSHAESTSETLVDSASGDSEADVEEEIEEASPAQSSYDKLSKVLNST